MDEEFNNSLVNFACKIIRTPSESGNESAVARIVEEEMSSLGYDEITMDSKNSVVGRLIGSGEGKSLLLNGHIDHVGAGSMKDAFSGDIIDGRPHYNGDVIWGRGSVDMKGAVAAMVYAAGAVRRYAIPVRGDVWVVANSLEELGRGEGICHVFNNQNIRADMAINGEATALDIVNGQTGRMIFKITTKGKQCHSSFPEQGKNAIYEMSRFLQTFVSEYRIPTHDIFGEIPFAVTQIASPLTDLPVVPGNCEITLRRRFTPDESKETIQAGLEAIVNLIKNSDPSFEAEVEYLGEFPSFYCDPSEDIVSLLAKATERVLGKRKKIALWRFSTEAGYLMQYGIPCAGFGPGYAKFAHTPDEFVPVDHIISSSEVYTEVIRLINNLI
jgi:putative selenium metabolism hydrolase